MAKAGKLNQDGYVHALDAKEYQRLRDQARGSGRRARCSIAWRFSPACPASMSAPGPAR
jgi:hypothetical protein